jgi:hypothetical protein
MSSKSLQSLRWQCRAAGADARGSGVTLLVGYQHERREGAHAPCVVVLPRWQWAASGQAVPSRDLKRHERSKLCADPVNFAPLDFICQDPGLSLSWQPRDDTTKMRRALQRVLEPLASLGAAKPPLRAPHQAAAAAWAVRASRYCSDSGGSGDGIGASGAMGGGLATVLPPDLLARVLPHMPRGIAPHVAVGLSGGVDSAVAAWLLKIGPGGHCSPRYPTRIEAC